MRKTWILAAAFLLAASTVRAADIPYTAKVIDGATCAGSGSVSGIIDLRSMDKVAGFFSVYYKVVVAGAGVAAGALTYTVYDPITNAYIGATAVATISDEESHRVAITQGVTERLTFTYTDTSTSASTVSVYLVVQ